MARLRKGEKHHEKLHVTLEPGSKAKIVEIGERLGKTHAGKFSGGVNQSAVVSYCIARMHELMCDMREEGRRGGEEEADTQAAAEGERVEP